MTLKDWIEEKKSLLGPEDTDTDVIRHMNRTNAHLRLAIINLRQPTRRDSLTAACSMRSILQSLVYICNALGCLPPEPWNKAIRRTGPSGSPILRASQDFPSAAVSEVFSSSKRLTCEWEVLAKIALEAPRPGIPASLPQKAMYQAFSRPYKDAGTLDALHRILWDHDKAMLEQPSQNIRDPVLTVLQASGTGKTRTVLQLCTRELGFYTCIRPLPVSSDPQYVTAPPTDVSVLQSLEPTARVWNENIIGAMRTVAAWLLAFLEIFADYCEREMVARGSTIDSQNDWTGFCKAVAAQLHDDISPGYRTCHADTTMDLGHDQVLSDEFEDFATVPPSAARVALLEDIQIRMSDLLKSEPFSAHENHWNEFTLAALMAPHVRRLQALRGGKLGLTFLALDSASSLRSHRLTALRRFAYQLRGMDFWILLIDTDPSVRSIVLDQETYDTRLGGHSSSYIGPDDPRRRVIEPFLEMRQDIFLKTEPDRTRYLDLVEGRHLASHLEWSQLVLKMGRPLHHGDAWKWRTCKPSAKYNGVAITWILRNLTGRYKVEDLMKGQSPWLVALTGRRVPLICTIEDYGDDCGRSSLAVADLFRRHPNTNWTAGIKAVSLKARENRLSQEYSGQEYVRTAVSAAIDFAFHPLCNPSPTSSNRKLNIATVEVPHHLFVIKVYDWLTALFGSTIANNPDVKKWAEHRWINFTHFGELGNVVTRKKPMFRPHLAETWSRYSALMGDRKQTDWHLLIVALESKEMPKLEDVLDTTKFCPIVIQIGDAAGDLSGQANFFAKSTYSRSEKPTGTLSIYIDLATNSPHRTFAKRNRKGRIDVAVNIGCTAAVPLWVFRKPDYKNCDVGFKGHEAAEDMLARWTNRFRPDVDRQTMDLMMGNVHLLTTEHGGASPHPLGVVPHDESEENEQDEPESQEEVKTKKRKANPRYTSDQDQYVEIDMEGREDGDQSSEEPGPVHDHQPKAERNRRKKRKKRRRQKKKPLRFQ